MPVSRSPEVFSAHYCHVESELPGRQAVYSGGKLSHALDAQKYIEEAAVLDLQSVINQAVLETRTRFYDVLLARDQIEVETLNVELLEEQLVDAKNRYEARPYPVSK